MARTRKILVCAESLINVHLMILQSSHPLKLLRCSDRNKKMVQNLKVLKNEVFKGGTKSVSGRISTKGARYKSIILRMLRKRHKGIQRLRLPLTRLPQISSNAPSSAKGPTVHSQKCADCAEELKWSMSSSCHYLASLQG